MKSANLCLICKGGKALCGHKVCPKLASMSIKPKVQGMDTDFFGPSISVFIGRYGYPDVFAGPMATFVPEEKYNDDPSTWFEMSYPDIVEMRSTLLRSKLKQNIFSRGKFVQENQELAMSVKPTDVEMEFYKKPVYRMSFSAMVQPMGPSANLKKLDITENPKIPKKVDYIVSDDLKAADASFELYKTEINTYKITTILSSGALGLEQNRKLVPTRWSITATDDIIAKNLIAGVKDFKSVNKYQVYESKNLDNHFVILLMPGNWEYEGFEAWAPGTVWSQGLKEAQVIEEYEPYAGRTKYADKQGGGYYAARIAVLEGLAEIRRQARVVVFREIQEGYIVPLGVWVVRETARNAFKNPKIEFDTQDEALKYIDSRLRLPVKKYIGQSRILRQKRLSDYLGTNGQIW
jgi:hypothetical protein